MSVYCLIDRSGSMANCLDDTIGGFNTFLNDQKINKCNFSINLFDHEYTNLFTGNIVDAPYLSASNYIPRGSTALFDSIGTLIKNVNEKGKVIIVILTDGFENSSKYYTKESIFDIITMKKNDNWEFIYLGANQDAIEISKEFGISGNSALSFDIDKIESAFKSLSCAVSRTVTGHTPVSFTPVERSISKC